MSTDTTRDVVLGEHTFGWNHVSPPPFDLVSASAERSATPVATSAQALPDDFDQRIRSVGEW